MERDTEFVDYFGPEFFQMINRPHPSFFVAAERNALILLQAIKESTETTLPPGIARRLPEFMGRRLSHYGMPS